MKQTMAGGVGSNEPKDPGTGTGHWHGAESLLTEVEGLAKELKRYTDFLDGITKSKPSKLCMHAMHRVVQISRRIRQLASKEKEAEGNNGKDDK